MSDDTQIAKIGNNLPQPGRPQQPIQANLNQYGNDSTQIAYVQHYDATTNQTVLIMQGAQPAGGTVVGQGVTFNYDCFNFFVLGTEQYDGPTFIVPKNRALTESTSDEMKARCAALTPEAIEIVKTFPALFCSENHNFTKTDPDHMLISLCQLILEGMLLTTDSGEYKLASFVDEQRMNRLYEKFILEYYAKECPQVTTTASQIPWALDDGIGTMLPVMQSDIMLTKDDTVLIIDAKYYTHTTQTQYDVHTLHSGNLYQIFTYVKNKDTGFGDKPHTVSGMLLYAATDEAIQPDNSYQMSGNKISVRTLDLNQEFSEIATQLNTIVDEHFSAS